MEMQADCTPSKFGYAGSIQSVPNFLNKTEPAEAMTAPQAAQQEADSIFDQLNIIRQHIQDLRQKLKGTPSHTSIFPEIYTELYSKFKMYNEYADRLLSITNV